MEYKEIVDEFIKSWQIDQKNILLILIYGSRVKGNYKSDSDLDVLIVVRDGTSYKLADRIQGISIDCNLYTLRDLYEEIWGNDLNKNRFFMSIIGNGLILKNIDDTFLNINYLLEEQDRDYRRGIIPSNLMNKVGEMYLEFRDTKEDRYYYQLLENIRRCYHYKKNCSDISMAKVYDVYRGNIKYDSYNLILPRENFRKKYLQAIEIKEYKERLEVIKDLLGMIDFKVCRDREEENKGIEIMNFNAQLAILYYHKIDNGISLIDRDHPYKDMFYNLLLNDMKLYLEELYEEGIRYQNKKERIGFLKKIKNYIYEETGIDFKRYQVPMFLGRSYGKIKVG